MVGTTVVGVVPDTATDAALDTARDAALDTAVDAALDTTTVDTTLAAATTRTQPPAPKD